jgi:UDP-N-acetylmuramate dehydrogenase
VWDEIEAALGGQAVRGEPMSRHTTLRIGGPADLFVPIASADALRDLVLLARRLRVPYLVLGAGSNVLVSDAGFRGLVILNKARRIEFEPVHAPAPRVQAESGVILPSLARECIGRGLAGLEWAVGVPGTVGGAVVGNAGAHGGDIAQSLVSAKILDSDGNVRDWAAQELKFGYRTSWLKSQAAHFESLLSRPVVLGAEFELKQAARQELEARAAELTEKRKRTQPPGASAGSMFKNPPGDYAGRLIEAAGLKGARVGEADISPVHANFIVNRGAASAADVYSLICQAREKVAARFGVTLELEIQLVGEW